MTYFKPKQSYTHFKFKENNLFEPTGVIKNEAGDEVLVGFWFNPTNNNVLSFDTFTVKADQLFGWTEVKYP